MVEHLTKKQVEDYCRQQLHVADLLPVSDHLGECETCRQRIESAANGAADFLALRAEIFDEAAEFPLSHLVREHLTAEQTGQYIERTLSGEELQTVVDHLTICAQCDLAVEDLEDFRNQVAPSLEHEYNPATTVSPSGGWWQRMAASLPVFFRKSPGLAFGAALAVLLLAMTTWLIWRSVRDRGPKQEVVVSPVPTPQPAPSSQPTPLLPPAPETPPPAPVVAELNDGGGQLILDQDGKFTGADDLPPVYRNMLKEAITTRRIERSPQLNGLTRPPSPLMGTDKERNEFSVIEPAGTILVTDRPAFRWSSLKGATAYVVEVYDSKFNLAAASPQLTSNSWASSQPLSRGEVYTWQVKAVKDGQEITVPRPPAPQAKFRILDSAKTNELARARRAYPSSHLTLALIYAKAGLLKEAEQELRLLQKANPGSEIVRSLLGQIRALRR